MGHLTELLARNITGSREFIEYSMELNHIIFIAWVCGLECFTNDDIMLDVRSDVLHLKINCCMRLMIYIAFLFGIKIFFFGGASFHYRKNLFIYLLFVFIYFVFF